MYSFFPSGPVFRATQIVLTRTVRIHMCLFLCVCEYAFVGYFVFVKRMFVAWNEIRFVSFHIVCCFSIRRTQASWLAFIWWDHIMPHSNIFTNTFDIFAVPIHYFLCPNVFFNRHKKQSTMFNRKKYAIRTKREENHQRRVCNYKWTAQSAIFCCVFFFVFLFTSFLLLLLLILVFTG